MRRSIFLLAAVLTITFLSSFPLSDFAYACSCAATSGTPQVRAQEAFEGAGVVFAGEVVDVSEGAPPTVMYAGPPVAVTLRVSDVWKGPRQETLEIYTGMSSASCGYEFQTGEKYLVYATDNLEVSLCSETKPLSNAGADLSVLGGGVLEEGGELPDTSGATSGLLYWMPGGPIALIDLAAMAGVLALVRTLSKRP